MSVIDELNAIAKDSYGGDLYARGTQELTKQQHEGYNAITDLANVIPEWVNALEQHGKKIALAAQNAYGNIPTEAWEDPIDDMSLDTNPVMSSANQKLANALQDAIEDARYDATKDPLIFGANVATAATGNPWILPFVQAFDIAHNVAKAENAEEGTGAKVAGENATMLALGVAAGGVSHGIGNALKNYLPNVARAMTTPLAGSTAGAAAVMAYDPNQLEYAKEHPLRAAYNFYGTDVALGVHKAIKGGNWSAKTNPTSDIADMAKKAEDTNPTVEAEVVDTPESFVDNPTPASPIKRRGKKAYKRRKAARDAAKTKQGVTTEETLSNRSETTTGAEEPLELSVTETYEGMAEPRLKPRKAETVAEEAFPENRPENQIVEQQNEARFNSEHEEALRAKEIYQGAYGDELTYGTANLYPKAVSVEDIWGTVNRMFPARVRSISNESTLGYFMIKGKGIVSRSFRGWSTICHEVGHGVSKKLNWGTTPEIQKELFDGATSIWRNGEYGNSAAANNFLVYVEEGRAAFMNEYMINPELAQKHFPLAYAELEKVLATDPKLANNLDVLGQQVRRWGNSTVMEKAEGMTHYADRYGVETIRQGISRGLDNIEKSLSWEFAPLSNIGNRFAEEFRGTKLTVEEDLGNVAQRSKEALNTIVRSLYDANEHRLDTTAAIQALSDRFNTALNNVVFTDIFTPFNVGGKRGKALKKWLTDNKVSDFYGGLTQYLIALRELELIRIKNPERIAALSKEIKPLQAKVAKIKAEYDAVMKTVTSSTAEITAVTKKLIDAQKELQRVQDAIKDIKEGRNDYKTTKSRAENEAIVKLCEELPEMKQAANLWRLWNENMLRIAVAGDILDAKVANGLLKNQPNYLPFRRSFEIEGFDEVIGTSKIEHLTKTGSDRVIEDPLAQAMINAKAVIRKIEQNNVAKTVANMADGENGHYLMMKVFNDIPADKQHQVISVWRGGKKQNYQCVADGLYDALTTANKSVEVVELNIIGRLATILSKMVRWGSTSPTGFGLANCQTDIIDAAVLNRDGRRGRLNARLEPLCLLWQGLLIRFADRLGNKENLKYRNEFYSQGIQYTANAGSAREITTNMRELVNSPSTLNKAKKATTFLFRKMEEGNQILEEAPRMALYKRVRDRQGSKFEAAHIASDSTVNFMRRGTAGREFNKYIPFANATIQGTLKTIRAFKEDPVGVNLAIAKYILLPTLVTYYFNHDEDWYKDMPLDKKNKAWYLKIGDNIHTWKKPPIIGQLYGSLVERMLDVALMDDDTGVVANELNSIVKGLLPDFIPTIALVPAEWTTNYSFYRDRPIVDSRLGKLKAEEQYTPYTSYTAIKAGQIFGVSPMKVDNAVYNLTSTMGYTLNSLIDLAMKDNQTSARKWTEWTRFTYTEGTSSSRSSDVFFKGMDKLEKEYNTARNKNKSLKADAKLQGMRKAKKAAMDKQKLIRENEANPKLTADQKRVVRDKLVKEQNEIYRKANSKYLNYKYIQAPK